MSIVGRACQFDGQIRRFLKLTRSSPLLFVRSMVPLTTGVQSSGVVAVAVEGCNMIASGV